MDLELVKGIVQVAFWIGALILAFLTYLNAKKTLLSPVNTEYQKRVFDSLTQLSERLFSELKIGAQDGLRYQRPMKEALVEICNKWEENKKSVEEFGLDLIEFPVSSDWFKFEKLADEVRFDLCVPVELKSTILSHLKERADASCYAHGFAVTEFVKQVNAEKSYHELSVDNFVDIENFYIEGMESAGMGGEEIYRKNQELMKEFILYIQSFDPSK